jgi:hypothetical protein
MQHKEVDCATIGAPSSAGMKGGATVEKSNLGFDNTIIVLGLNAEGF